MLYQIFVYITIFFCDYNTCIQLCKKEMAKTISFCYYSSFCFSTCSVKFEFSVVSVVCSSC